MIFEFVLGECVSCGMQRFASGARVRLAVVEVHILQVRFDGALVIAVSTEHTQGLIRAGKGVLLNQIYKSPSSEETWRKKGEKVLLLSKKGSPRMWNLIHFCFYFQLFSQTKWHRLQSRYYLYTITSNKLSSSW